MTIHVDLYGPSEVPGAPQITAAAVRVAVEDAFAEAEEMFNPAMVHNFGTINSGVLALDAGAYRASKLVLTADLTNFTVSNSADPTHFVNSVVAITQGGTGSFEVTFPASLRWQGSYAPSLSTAPGATDILNIMSFDGGTTWIAAIAAQVAPP